MEFYTITNTNTINITNTNTNTITITITINNPHVSSELWKHGTRPPLWGRSNSYKKKNKHANKNRDQQQCNKTHRGSIQCRP